MSNQHILCYLKENKNNLIRFVQVKRGQALFFNKYMFRYSKLYLMRYLSDPCVSILHLVGSSWLKHLKIMYVRWLFTNMIYKSSSCWTRIWIILAYGNSFLPVQHELMMILLIHTLGKIWMISKHRKTSHIYQLMLKNWKKHDNALRIVYESCLDFIVWCLMQLTYNHIPYR